MSVFNHTRPDRRTTIQRKPKPTPAITQRHKSSNSFDAQVAQLKRLDTPQRQALISQIGRTHGNRHVQRLIKSLHTPSTKPQASSLSVNAPNDIYEQEADRVADEVMSSKTVAGATPPAGNNPSNVQTSSDQPSPVSPNVEQSISRMQGGGSALPDSERSFFESRMGHDFSQVRIHTSANAIQTSRDLNARAFTVGADIAFNQNEYRPGTSAGRHLMAHELTHVVQQGQATPRIQRAGDDEWHKKGETISSDDALTERVDAGHGWSKAYRINWDLNLPSIAQNSTTKVAFDEALPEQITMIFGEELEVADIRAQIDQAVADGKPDEANELEKKLFQANQYAVVEALNVTKSSRYKADRGGTYCNVYAYDVVSAMGGYLPRVWWTDDSIDKINNGEAVKIKFSLDENTDTVREMRANHLTDWMKAYGASFGWRKATSVAKAQEAANDGKIAILLAAKINPKKSGHVNVILPETEQHKAKYDAAGNFDMPLQSQAGGSNFKYSSTHYSNEWWNGSLYRDGAAWIYEGESNSSFLTPEELGGMDHGGGGQTSNSSPEGQSGTRGLFGSLSSQFTARQDHTRTPRPGDYGQPTNPTQQTAVRSTATPSPSDMNPALKGVIMGQSVLKNGDKGDGVAFIQRGLIQLGFSVGPDGADGDFGDNTETAVKAFQTAYGLSVTGQVDKQTVLGAMTVGGSGRASQLALAGSMVGTTAGTAAPSGTITTTGNTTNSSSNPGSFQDNPDAYHDVASRITSVMEGGSPSSLNTEKDGGIVSYGVHQATLASGALELVVEHYLASSQTSTASTLKGYMSKVRTKDKSLQTDTAFHTALKAAGKEEVMKVAQDKVFFKNYWKPAVDQAGNYGIQSPLGYALLYDTNTQGGMEAVTNRAIGVCGGMIGEEVNGKTISEAEFLLAYVDEREKRLNEIADANEKKGKLKKAEMLRNSVYRTKGFRALIKAGNLNVTGPSGEVNIIGPGEHNYTITGYEGSVGTSSSPSATSDTNNAPILSDETPETATEPTETLSDLEAASHNATLQKVLAGDKVLRIGSKGDAVEFMQKGLRWLGYDIGPAGADGDFGGNTDSAVRAFQGDYGLSVDGDVGKNTLTVGLQVLFGYQPTTQAEQETTSDAPSDQSIDIPDVKESNGADDLISIGKALLGDDRYTKGHAYVGFTGAITGKEYKPGDVLDAKDAVARYKTAKPTWCNTFARDLVKHFLGEDPFGGRDLTSTDMYNFMLKNDEIFTELSSINVAWSEINNGEIVYFCAPGHISTGVPTPKSEMQHRTYKNVPYHFGKVIQAGKTNAHMNLSGAWTGDDFHTIKVFKYIPENQR